MKRRVVITGLGVVAPGGIGKTAFWNNVKDGISSTALVTQFESEGMSTGMAAEVATFDPRDFLGARSAMRMDRSAHFALVAAMMAYEDAHLIVDPVTSKRTGVFEGTALGGLNATLARHREYLAAPELRLNPMTLLKGMSGNASSIIAMEFHLHGPAITFSNGCVSSSYAFGHGFRKIQHGN